MPLRLNTATGRWVVVATVLGSTMVFLDATVVNVALPTIGREFDAGISELQWVLNGYLLSLAALILLGGSLGDRFGRRRIFVLGAIWFTAASVLCGLAPTGEWLIAGRVLQGVGGALLTPGSLAIIEAGFVREDRGRAIGIWSGLAGVSTAIGPPLGGWLIDVLSWRAVFFLNVPLGILVVILALRHVPESRDESLEGSIDYAGAGLAVVALGAISWALIEGPARGFDEPTVLAGLTVGLLSVALFLVRERRAAEPMLPLELFRSRTFSAANMITFVVYGAFGGALFLLSVLLQTALGYSPLVAGLATLPVTFIMLLFSARSGAVAQRIGPRLPLTLGPLVLAASLLLMHSIDVDSSYLTGVLPPVILLSAGLVIVVAPVTATTLASAPDERAGVASAVSNAVSRTGQLFAIALLPAIGGLQGAEYEDPDAIVSAFQTAVLFAAALCALGAAIAWRMIDNDCLHGEKVSARAPGPARRSGSVAD
ncbi:MAG: DHA2 family efflux MFS transporter permease subunit [Thermoleophilaceae bacterium]|nr:DHA2 family efflux MFS transporter permease subunit [Thermoleophilaceae bacterium]